MNCVYGYQHTADSLQRAMANAYTFVHIIFSTSNLEWGGGGYHVYTHTHRERELIKEKSSHNSSDDSCLLLRMRAAHDMFSPPASLNLLLLFSSES